MSMFEGEELNAVVTEPVSDKKYVPAGDDYLTDYLDEIEIPKQEQVRPEIPEDEYFEETEEAPTGPSYNNYQLETSKTTAFFLVKTVDQVLSTGIAAYALEPDSKTFEAEREQLDEIAGHLSVYFAENAFNLPPWAMAAIPSAIVITKKFNMAGKLRKANLDKKQAEDELKEVRKQLDKVRLEKQLAEAKNELSDLKAHAATN